VSKVKASANDDYSDSDSDEDGESNGYHTFGTAGCLRTVGDLDINRKRTNSESETDAIKKAKEEHNHYDDLD
jgi:hypothetical protein